MSKLNDCKCAKCIDACEYRPGWFIPGEAEKAATLMKLTLKQFFDQYLGVDWWEGEGGGNEIFIIAPATISMNPGEEYPGDPAGRCIFLKKGLCEIHEAKPFECRESHCTDSSQKQSDRHEAVKELWKNNQNQIIELLGRNPESKPYQQPGDCYGFLKSIFGN